MAIGGALLRFGQTGLRVLELLAAAVALGIFSYFLASLTHHSLPIATWIRAVEGIAGSAVLYTIFGVLLTLFLGGMAVFGFLAVFLDICFAGAFAAVAYFTRHGASSCVGNVNTPLGSGNTRSSGTSSNNYGFGSAASSTYRPKLGLSCRLNTAVFAVSIILIFLFLVTAVMQVLLVRHHKKEKRYGPSPSNNYTKGSGRTPFWKRKQKTHNTKDAEAATALPHSGHHATRQSHETSTTLGNGAYTSEAKYGHNGHGEHNMSTLDNNGQAGYREPVTATHGAHNSVGYGHNDQAGYREPIAATRGHEGTFAHNQTTVGSNRHY